MDRYVYLLLDRGVPFYVGKGTHADHYSDKYRRPLAHIQEAQKPVVKQTNKLKCAYINKLISEGRTVEINIIADNISEEESIEIETKTIRQYGRLSDGGILTNLVSEQRQISHELRRKPVYCFDSSGTLVHEFLSIKDAAAHTGCGSGNIVWCCRGKAKTAGGYLWSYTPIPPQYTLSASWNIQSVDCYLPDGNLVCTYSSIDEASKCTGIGRSNISASLRQLKGVTAGGFVWVNSGEEFKMRKLLHAGKPTKAVIQLSLAGDIIETFASIKEAERQTKILTAGISRCCRQEQHSAGGFLWKFANEDNV